MSAIVNWWYGAPAKAPSSKKYGWNHNETMSEEDETKFAYKVMNYHTNLAAIKEIDLTPKFPPVYDQGALGSCTANAIIGAYEYTINKENETYVPMSRLGLYWMERNKEHPDDMTTDTGAQIKTGVNITHDNGVGLETLCPYDISKFAEKPSDAFFDDLQYHKSVKIERIKKTIKDIDQCLLDGCPVIFGFLVYSSFESADVATGKCIVPIPDPKKEEFLGGHAVVLVGATVKDGKECYKIRNSWGSGWGDNGCFYVEKKFMTTSLGVLGMSQLCSDLWTIRKVEDAPNDPHIQETDEQKLSHIKQILGVESTTNELEPLFDGIRNLVVKVESKKPQV